MPMVAVLNCVPYKDPFYTEQIAICWTLVIIINLVFWSPSILNKWPYTEQWWHQPKTGLFICHMLKSIIKYILNSSSAICIKWHYSVNHTLYRKQIMNVIVTQQATTTCKLNLAENHLQMNDSMNDSGLFSHHEEVKIILVAVIIGTQHTRIIHLYTKWNSHSFYKYKTTILL